MFHSIQSPNILLLQLDTVINYSWYNSDGWFVLTDPRLTDYDTLLENLRDLKEGKSIEAPIYDFKTSSRVGYRLPDPPLKFLDLLSLLVVG